MRHVVRLLVAVALVAAAPAALAAFTSATSAANTVATAADWIAPSASSTVIGKTTGYLAGSIKQGGTYYVYANVADSGNPASGIATVKADVSAVTSGQTNLTLTAGTYSVNGVSYNYRSASQTAGSPLSGTKNYTITSADALAYSNLQTGYTVALDNTAPTATGISTGNTGGGNQGLAEAGDTITFTFSEQIDPQSILAGWTGASTNVTVEFQDGGCLLVLCGSDSFTIPGLPFGTVDLASAGYYGCTVIGIVCDKTPASFVNSAMVASANTITITLGARSGGSGSFNDVGSNNDMAWDSTTTPYDAAGNAASGNIFTETDNDFEF
ncbi:MAG TPA: hypothetical protein VJS45_00275 [Acidimicrobiia bacterium]|nr:hypothetical protein [Acidimicrobiia bacterium]